MNEEPSEKSEEISYHPADKTFHTLHEKSKMTKEQLVLEREELARLMNRASENDEETEKKIQILKTSIIKKHNELMEILKNEVRISQENNKKQI